MRGMGSAFHQLCPRYSPLWDTFTFYSIHVISKMSQNVRNYKVCYSVNPHNVVRLFPVSIKPTLQNLEMPSTSKRIGRILHVGLVPGQYTYIFIDCLTCHFAHCFAVDVPSLRTFLIIFISSPTRIVLHHN